MIADKYKEGYLMDEGVAILVWILLAIIWFNFGFSWFCVALLAGIFLSGSK